MNRWGLFEIGHVDQKIILSSHALTVHMQIVARIPGIRFLCSSLFLALLSSVIHAEITVEAHYRMGEDELLADSSGNKRDFLNLVEGEIQTGSAPNLKNPSGNQYKKSKKYLDLVPPSIGGLYEIGYSVPNDNFGIDVYVRISDLERSGAIFSTAGGNVRRGVSIGFKPEHGIRAAISGVAHVGDPYMPSSTAEWVHVAIVSNGGTTTFYVNGEEFGESVNKGIPAVETGDHFFVGRMTEGDFLVGSIDELRIFTFEPGAFDKSDLLFHKKEF